MSNLRQRATAAKYRVTSADQGKSITVVVTAVTADLPPGSATSAPTLVKYTADVTLSLSRQVFLSSQRTTATATVDSSAAAPPTGDVTITVNGTTVTATLVDGVAQVQLPNLTRGVHKVTASYPGDATTTSGSATKLIWVLF